MSVDRIKSKMSAQNIFHSEFTWMDHPTVVGYHKQFRWSWMATQLNTFYVATDCGTKEVTIPILEKHLAEAFAYAEKKYNGWPRGLQSAIGVVCILQSSNISEEVKAYCRGLKSGKKWAGFAIPVAIDSTTHETFQFTSTPMWGAIYFPYFKRMINELTQ